MLNTVIKGGVTLVTVAVLSAGAWGQNFVPQGDFEGVATGPVTVGSPGAAGFTQTPTRATPQSRWNVVDNSAAPPTVLSGAQDAMLQTSVNPAGSALQTNTFVIEAGNRYTVRFTAAASAASSAGLSLTVANPAGTTVDSTSANLTPTGFGFSVANLTTTAQDYIFTFVASTSSSGFLTFTGDIQPTVLGTFVNNFIQLDNISVIVPELNASSAVMPLALMACMLLLAYDRRRDQRNLTVLN